MPRKANQVEKFMKKNVRDIETNTESSESEADDESDFEVIKPSTSKKRKPAAKKKASKKAKKDFDVVLNNDDAEEEPLTNKIQCGQRDGIGKSDCLHLQIYRDSKERRKNGPTKSSLSLDGFLGMETGFTLEEESNTIAIICKDIVVLLAFDSREVLIQWQVKIRAHLCEEQHFLVQITNLPAKSKLTCGPSRLHLQDYSFCLVSGIPPRVLCHWPIKELRRFGVIDGKFCFEGGSQCHKGEGLHVLHTNQTEELAKCFELASQGKLNGKRRLAVSRSSPINCSVRMSLQQTKCHNNCECGGSGSNESSRPLISSSSDSSVCDACSEIIRLNNCNNYANELSASVMNGDEPYLSSSRSTCSTILRCESNSSSIAMVPPYMSSSASVNTADISECFFTSSASLAAIYVNNCVDNRSSIPCLSNNIDCNSLALTANDCNHRCSWTLSSCNRCGHHYCPENNGCSDDVMLNLNKSVPNNAAISAINLSDLRSVSPISIHDCLRSSHHHHSHNLNANKTPSSHTDRTSLCSQSSHSSGVSNSSNSSGSHSSGRSGRSCVCVNEYSVPRSCGSHLRHHLISEMFYDKPKNVVHKICNVRDRSDLNPICLCQLKQNDVANHKNDISVCSDDVLLNLDQSVENNASSISAINISDLRSVSPTSIHDCLNSSNNSDNHQNHNPNTNATIPSNHTDRTSLCSQSSHNSGVSGVSGVSNSSSHSSCVNEYSVPRSCVSHLRQLIEAEMLYDKPKNILHTICNIRDRSELTDVCLCQLEQKDVNNSDAQKLAVEEIC